VQHTWGQAVQETEAPQEARRLLVPTLQYNSPKGQVKKTKGKSDGMLGLLVSTRILLDLVSLDLASCTT